MKYMLLLFNEDVTGWTSDPKESLKPWRAFAEEAAQRCASVEGLALKEGATAKVVSVRGGKALMTDGPFIETKEQLGGYYVLDCESIDVALELAAKVPWAQTGHIEVRPVMTIGG
jgi:hypothetical protein